MKFRSQIIALWASTYGMPKKQSMKDIIDVNSRSEYCKRYSNNNTVEFWGEKGEVLTLKRKAILLRHQWTMQLQGIHVRLLSYGF